jgi:tRNA-2-methylthio-N6-dimethylallyladenosine synthase
MRQEDSAASLPYDDDAPTRKGNFRRNVPKNLFVRFFAISLLLASLCQAFTPFSRLSTSLRSTQSASTKSKSKWFPTKIQQDIDYTSVVQSLYLRHIVVETKETASLIMEQLSNSSESDSFARIARQVSACPFTKEDGGVIGWVDTTNEGNNEPFFTSMIPMDVLETLIHVHQPKTGDVLTISSKSTDQVHIVKVEEVFLKALLVPKLQSKNEVMDYKSTLVGAHSGINAMIPRTKLKGHGVLPVTPTFQKASNGNELSSSSAKTYMIQTNGCQMNVADSERLEGILQTQLGLHKITDDEGSTNRVDVLIVNTCSIRDHAEQKLYNLLGPFRARKRQVAKDNNNLAIIVTGCVAQQEGYDLLQKMPEIDVVLGPQYVPFLGTVLEQLEQGHQLVLTAPMLLPDNYTPTNQVHDDFSIKPVRGHSVRAWVNAIYGCNEHCSYCV